MEQLLPIALIVIVFYLLVMRPAQARQKQYRELQAMRETVAPGMRIMMTSGIHGTVVSVAEETVVLEIAPNTPITIAKAAISTIEPSSGDEVNE